jgi:FtsZ-binding cell division protein ZapB
MDDKKYQMVIEMYKERHEDMLTKLVDLQKKYASLESRYEFIRSQNHNLQRINNRLQNQIDDMTEER